jgi:flagellar motor switch protein FliG
MLSNLDKAALVLQAIGPERAGEVLKHMDPDIVPQIIKVIAAPPQLSLDEKVQVIEEFAQFIEAQSLINEGGLTYARQVLERAYGKDQAENILSSLRASLRLRPFESLASVKTEDLVALLQTEHPQTIALVLSYLPAHVGSEVLSHLSGPVQVEVLRRISTLEGVQPRVLRRVEALLMQRVDTSNAVDFNAPRGLDVAVGILNRVDRSTEKALLKSLTAIDPDLVEELKKRMFLFEDIASLDDRTVQAIIRKADKKDLALALRTLSQDMQDKFFRNMSEQTAEEVHTEMSESGPVTLKVVEAAQGRIVSLARQMEEDEEIELIRGGPESVYV